MTYLTKQIIVAVASIAVVSFGIYKISSYKDAPFKQVDFDYRNTVINQTSKKYLDTIVHSGLSSVGVHDVSVVIQPISKRVRDSFEGGGVYHAYIVFRNNTYTIYIDDVGKLESITVLSHEIIHLQQYELGQLKIINGTTPVWKGEIIDISNVPYEDRPWEKEAFNKQNSVENKIKNILY